MNLMQGISGFFGFFIILLIYCAIPFLFYWIIMLAVKNGMLAAWKERDKE